MTAPDMATLFEGAADRIAKRHSGGPAGHASPGRAAIAQLRVNRLRR